MNKINWHYWLRKGRWRLPDAIALVFDYELEGTSSSMRLNNDKTHRPPKKPKWMSEEKYAEETNFYYKTIIHMRNDGFSWVASNDFNEVMVNGLRAKIVNYNTVEVDKDMFLKWAYDNDIALPKELDEYIRGIAKQRDRVFPKDLAWREIEIMFLNDEEVIVSYRGERFSTDYRAMGFEDKRNNKPNEQWKLLSNFAEYNGRLPRDKGYFNKDEFENTKQKKNKLSKALKDYFCISDDPFLPHIIAKDYVIKMKVLYN